MYNTSFYIDVCFRKKEVRYTFVRHYTGTLLWPHNSISFDFITKANLFRYIVSTYKKFKTLMLNSR